jgi:hypothetical protein
VADLVARHGFKFENSTRLDDVFDHRRPYEWNLERVRLWRYLARTSLNRMLFGLESGVETILRRFNKAISAADVIRAVRIVTACGVAVRLTYITFDPLMTLDELHSTFEFLGRTDLLLRRADELTDEELLTASDAPARVEELSLRRPLYSEVPYMLTSLESLVGSRYLDDVEAAGLAGGINVQLGRRDARYKDWRIGVLSRAAQAWVDRQFALDYTMKGLEKTSPDSVAEMIRDARRLLKAEAHRLLGEMIAMAKCIPAGAGGSIAARLEEEVYDAMERRSAALGERLEPSIETLMEHLPPQDVALVRQVAERWCSATEWGVING